MSCATLGKLIHLFVTRFTPCRTGQMMMISTGNNGIDNNTDRHTVSIHVLFLLAQPSPSVPHPPLHAQHSISPLCLSPHAILSTRSKHAGTPATAFRLVHAAVTFLTTDLPACWWRLRSFLGLVLVLQLTLRAKFWDIGKLRTDLAT